MFNKIILDLKSAFSMHNFTNTLRDNNFLFVYEVSEKDINGKIVNKFTEMSDKKPIIRHFKVNNPNPQNVIGHICIDGDFIPFRQEKYNHKRSSFSDGRPDSIIFDNNVFVFLELKVEQEDTTWGKEDAKWKKLFEGACQILDFVNYLRDNGFEINSYYNVVLAVICMRFEPNFSILSRGNAYRNKELFRISQKLGFEIKAQNNNVAFEFK